MPGVQLVTTSGVYEIRNTLDGKVYVGCSVNLTNRFKAHRSLLNKGTHHSPYLQNAWTAYGESSFRFTVVKFCPVENLRKEEDILLNSSKSYLREFGYNIEQFSEHRRLSDETKQKLSDFRKTKTGWTHTPETKEKMRLARVGKSHDAETRQKLREFRLGKPMPEETKQKISKANTGKTNSSETRKKISESKKGIPRPKEVCEKVRQARLGSKASEETKLKMRESHLRRKLKSNI